MSTPEEHFVIAEGGQMENALALKQANARIEVLESELKDWREMNANLEERLAASEKAAAQMREVLGLAIERCPNCDGCQQDNDGESFISEPCPKCKPYAEALATTAGTGYFAKCPKCGWEEKR